LKQNDVVEALERMKVNIVLDVRWWAKYPLYFSPFAETRPGFVPFKQRLEENNIRYFYEHVLGNPSYLRHHFTDDPVLLRDAYIRYIKDDSKAQETFLRYIKLLRTEWKDSTVCFICFCPTTDIRYCHRFWLKTLFEDELKTERVFI
jgi:hypothetical protein